MHPVGCKNKGSASVRHQGAPPEVLYPAMPQWLRGVFSSTQWTNTADLTNHIML